MKTRRFSSTFFFSFNLRVKLRAAREKINLVINLVAQAGDCLKSNSEQTLLQVLGCVGSICLRQIIPVNNTCFELSFGFNKNGNNRRILGKCKRLFQMAFCRISSIKQSVCGF